MATRLVEHSESSDRILGPRLIAVCSAGTSALKGDFTRTGKRDLSGMLNDGVNSLARLTFNLSFPLTFS
jgi:hypothetical protein